MKTWEEVLKDVRLRVNLMEDQEIQDIIDMAVCAQMRLNLVRCDICDRVVDDGFICPHCDEQEISSMEIERE